VVVVPIRIGGGTRIKIYEAMAMGRPVVSTTVGAEGLPVTDGENIVLADDPATMARCIVDLLSNPSRARDLGSRSQSWVRNNFAWDQVAAQFMEQCEGVVRRFGSEQVGVAA